MDTEYQASEPENATGLLPDGSIDKEGAMAKADLFKLGKYAYKLFKKLEDDDQLESWVQAKITKAADYLASVYHYLEYEMKFSEYGHQLDNSDVLSESEKRFLKNKLLEAQEKIKELKIVEAKKTNAVDILPIRNLVAKNAKATTSGAGAHESEKDKLPRKAKHKNKDIDLDEGKFDPEKFQNAMDKTNIKVDMSGKSSQRDRDAYDELVKKGTLVRDVYDANGHFNPAKPIKWAKNSKEKKLDELDKSTLKSYTKSASQDLVPLATKLANTTSSKKQDELGRKISNRTRGIATATDKMEESKPSAGLTKKQKSSTVKAAKAGKDIGKPGKGFEKVAKKAAKEYGSKEAGEKVAAASMWKNKVKAVKESIEHEEKYNPYVEQGFENRKDYLNSLADDYDVDVQTVYHLARILGPSEDFDMLVSTIEDHAERNMYEQTDDSGVLTHDPKMSGYEPDGESVGKNLTTNPLNTKVAPKPGAEPSVQASIESLKNSLPQLYAKIKADPALNAAIVKDPTVLVNLISGGNVKESQIAELSTDTYKAVANKADRAKYDAVSAYDDAEHYDREEDMATANRKYKNHKKAAEFSNRKVAHREPEMVNESVELSRIKKLSGL